MKNTNITSCVVIAGNREDLNVKVEKYLNKKVPILSFQRSSKNQIDELAILDLGPSIVFNFLGSYIYKKLFTKVKIINFHPAPPEWPGVGAASHAIYNNDETFGATAHIINKEIDAGPILRVERFPIIDGDSCADIFKKAEDACYTLFTNLIDYIVENDNLPPNEKTEWKRKAISRQEFEKWLILDPENEKNFRKKIKAARHPKFPGPYVILHGHKFSLYEEY